MSKNRRASATQIPYYHVIMGIQAISVKYFSAPRQFSCRAANFPAAFSRAEAQRRKYKFPRTAPRPFSMTPFFRGKPRQFKKRGLALAHLQTCGDTCGLWSCGCGLADAHRNRSGAYRRSGFCHRQKPADDSNEHYRPCQVRV